MKKITRFCLYFALILTIFSSQPTFAITPDQEGSISLYCNTIRQTLQTIQHSDSRTRTYLGAYYETILTDYMTPLNIRLVKNNHSNTALTKIQSDFALEKANFSEKFINYSKSLETLISLDCRANPTDFYDQLVRARDERELVHQSALKLNALVGLHLDAVQNLKGEL